MTHEVISTAAVSPTELLHAAMERGVNAEQLQALMQLEREWRADRATEAFNRAMTAFRGETLEIIKDRRVEFKGTRYLHAGLDAIVEIATPALAKHGLSHSWSVKQNDAGSITVTCLVMHELGGSRQCSITGMPDGSGGKNSIQAIGSTITYLERYTLLAATGLAAKGTDTDAMPQPAEKITEQQAADLQSLMEEVGIIGERRARAFKVWGIESLEQIEARNLAAVVKSVEAKRK